MRNLIRAEIYRYKNNWFFWFTLCAALLAGAFYGFVSRDGVFDDMFVVTLFVILAVFISLSIGREYGDGTIRNKVIAGKTKKGIFLSKLVTSISVSVIMTTTFLVPCAAMISAEALSNIPADILLWTVFGFFLLNISWAVLFTFVSMLISSREIAGILNFVLIIAIMFGSYQLESMIGQPEFIETEECSYVPMAPEEVKQIHDGTWEGSYSWDTDENGVATYYKMVVTDKSQKPNPHYVAEPYDTILQSVDSMLPHGQINEYVSCLTDYAFLTEYAAVDAAELVHPRIQTFPVYSLFLITVVSGMGLLLFRKKDLK